MSTKPLSQNAIGRELGLSSAGMVKLKKQGCPTGSVEAVRAWRQANQNIAARKPEPKPPGGIITEAGIDAVESLDEARTRLMIADADLAELKRAEATGKFLKKAEVNSTAFEIARALRDGLMNCARRIAADVAGLSSAADCEAVIDREHRALLESMAHRITAKLGTAAA